MVRSAPAFFALPMELEDVPVELDSEQKIAVFELRYMAQMGESLKAYGGNAEAKKLKRQELEAGLTKILKERRKRLKQYKLAAAAAFELWVAQTGECVTIPRGKMFVFKGNWGHCGARHSSPCLRVHVFGRPVGSELKAPGSVWDWEA